MHTLARICVQRPVFATVLTLTLLVVGIAGYMGLGLDRFPNVEFPYVSVVTAYPGASPDEVETEISDTIEERVNTIGGLEMLTSTSSEGMSIVTLQFGLDVDPADAAADVRSKVALAEAGLPPDAEKPVVMKLDVGAMPVLTISVSSKGTLRQTYDVADRIIRRRIESVQGVGEVDVIGGRERQINVIIDPYRLRAYGLSAKDVTDALRRHNAQIPGGVIEQGDRQLTLRTQGRVQSVAAFGDLPLRGGDSGTVYVRDVAVVEDGEARVTSAATVNGDETVLIQIVKQSDANALAVIDAVKERLRDLEEVLPPGVTLRTVSDSSRYIEASLHAVQEHLLLGALLAARKMKKK